MGVLLTGRFNELTWVDLLTHLPVVGLSPGRSRREK